MFCHGGVEQVPERFDKGDPAVPCSDRSKVTRPRLNQHKERNATPKQTQTDRQTDRQTDGHTRKHTDTQAHRHTEKKKDTKGGEELFLFDCISLQYPTSLVLPSSQTAFPCRWACACTCACVSVFVAQTAISHRNHRHTERHRYIQAHRHTQNSSSVPAHLYM